MQLEQGWDGILFMTDLLTASDSVGWGNLGGLRADVNSWFIGHAQASQQPL